MTFIQEMENFLLLLQREYGFNIPLDRMRDCLVCASSITDVREVYYRMQSLVCSSQEQVEIFQSTFSKKFFNQKPPKKGKTIDPKEIDRLKRDLTTTKGNHTRNQKAIERHKTRIEEIQTEREALAEEISKAQQQKLGLQAESIIADAGQNSAEATVKPDLENKSVQAILKKLEETFNRVDALTKDALTPFVTKTKALSEIQQALMSADYNTKLDDCFKEMMDAAASYRNAHNQEAFRLLLQAMGDVKELKTAAAKTIKSVDKKGLKTARETAARLLKEIEEIDSKIQSMMETRDNLEKERKSSLNSIKILEQDVQRAQKKIDSMQKRVEEAAPVIKEQAMNHRPDFLEGVKAVQTTAEVAELMKTDLKKMSASEKEKICSYIMASARVFKQTLRRKDNTIRKKQIDVKNTIRLAAQTNGEPIKIKYKEPKKSHAKVIIMADISGSCRAASTLALYFMALMGTVFPGGCRKFVFVNSLIPVDSAFRDADVDEGIETVLRTVQTRGVYSDYGTVVDQLKKDYGGIIHKDTTVIILGDARNNKNATHEDEVKYIADRCKKLIWLNPDDPQKWDQGDSVIGRYKEAGATVYRVQTVGDLIEFLLSIRV